MARAVTQKPRAPQSPKTTRGSQARRRSGRRPLIEDDDLVGRLVQYLQAGNTFRNTADLVGISERALFNWLERGETAADGDEQYVQFLQQVKTARATAQARRVARIELAAEHQWQAAAWLLERSDPEHWGRRDHMRISGGSSDDAPIRVESSLDPLARLGLQPANLSASEQREAAVVMEAAAEKVRAMAERSREDSGQS